MNAGGRDGLSVVRILGASRSGTTIVSKALETIEGAVFIGELDRFVDGTVDHHRLCSCGEAVGECSVWRGVAPLSEEARGDSIQHAEHFDLFYKTLAAELGAQILIESSKSVEHMSAMTQHSCFDSSVLHLVRDPRGILNSRSRGWKRKGGNVGHAGIADSLRVALWWRRSNRAIESSVPSDRTSRLRYEEFCARPRDVVADIAEHLGTHVRRGSWPDLRTMQSSAGHVAFGNPSRTTHDRSVIRHDDAWRSMWWLAQDLNWFASMPTARRYGYRYRSASTSRA